MVIYPIGCFKQMIGKVEPVEDISLLSQKVRIAVVYRWDEKTSQNG